MASIAKLFFFHWVVSMRNNQLADAVFGTCFLAKVFSLLQKSSLSTKPVDKSVDNSWLTFLSARLCWPNDSLMTF